MVLGGFVFCRKVRQGKFPSNITNQDRISGDKIIRSDLIHVYKDHFSNMTSLSIIRERVPN